MFLYASLINVERLDRMSYQIAEGAKQIITKYVKQVQIPDSICDTGRLRMRTVRKESPSRQK